MARRYKTSSKTRSTRRKYRKLRSQYENYKDQLEARKKLFAERGLTFFDDKELTFRDYKTARADKINDLKMDIKEGKRKTVGNINRELVSDQAYELSSRQADVLSKYLLENEFETLDNENLVFRYIDESGQERINLKKKIDLMMKIRQGEFIREDIGLWDMINDFRAQYFSLSKNEQDKLKRKWSVQTFAEAVRKEVGQTFFNSPD